MDNIISKISFSDTQNKNFLDYEWLLTNALGGYSSCSLAGIPTRKYHGILISACPPPLGRTMSLNHLIEEVILPNGKQYILTTLHTNEQKTTLSQICCLKEFRLEAGLPIWIYDLDGIEIEKRIFMIHHQNSVQITYKLLQANSTVKLLLTPLLHFRSHEAPVNQDTLFDYSINFKENGIEISALNFPTLRLHTSASLNRWTKDSKKNFTSFYQLEFERGYESTGKLCSLGNVEINLEPQQPMTFTASIEPWEVIHQVAKANMLLNEKDRREQLLKKATLATDSFSKNLVLAADQFIISPLSRLQVHSDNLLECTIIAGYPWFTDWGRDTMIAFEGLTLCTGRYEEAKSILMTFHRHIKNGLIPNMFPEGQNKGLYHTADATLWFFHAIDRYIIVTEDRELLRYFLPALMQIISCHLEGTDFGIKVDSQDSLLMQGAEGYQLTWMDAKVDNWVVTPRRGKAVEINALWYNALRLMEEWTESEMVTPISTLYHMTAKVVYESFNKRFWNTQQQCLFDVVDGIDGDDAECRPNQLLALSLKYAVLDPIYWKDVLKTVEKELLTPYGLRSLSPLSTAYKAYYEGNLFTRDAAYHQGTVWAWLIGPFIDAWLKVYPEKKFEARAFLENFRIHANEFGMGSISEIFDATAPFKARGCIAQAWSVAEVLRCWLKITKF